MSLLLFNICGNPKEVGFMGYRVRGEPLFTVIRFFMVPQPSTNNKATTQNATTQTVLGGECTEGEEPSVHAFPPVNKLRLLKAVSNASVRLSFFVKNLSD